MRRAVEVEAWGRLKRARSGDESRQIDLPGGVHVDLANPCVVIGGRNGAGKSRLLRELALSLGDEALLADLHHLCEQALIMLRSRDELNEMLEEFDAVEPNAERLDDLRRVVGRDYDGVDWYSLELEPPDPVVAERFKWSGDQPLVPYFRSEFCGITYSAPEMGLGEFSVHFLFWVLDSTER